MTTTSNSTIKIAIIVIVLATIDLGVMSPYPTVVTVTVLKYKRLKNAPIVLLSLSWLIPWKWVTPSLQNTIKSVLNMSKNPMKIPTRQIHA